MMRLFIEQPLPSPWSANCWDKTVLNMLSQIFKFSFQLCLKSTLKKKVFFNS